MPVTTPRLCDIIWSLVDSRKKTTVAGKHPKMSTMSLFFFVECGWTESKLAKGLFCRLVWSRIHSFRSFSADAIFFQKEKNRDVNIISFIHMALNASGYAPRPLEKYARQNRSRRGGFGGVWSLEHLGLFGCEIHGGYGIKHPKDR